MPNLLPNALDVFGIADDQAADQPVPVNAFSMLAAPAFFRAVSFLSENLAAFPRSVRRDGARPKPSDRPHPLAALMGRRPNQFQNATRFWRTLYLHAAHRGNGYARIRRDPVTLRPVALENLQPDAVLPFRYTPDGGATEQFYAVGVGRADIVPGLDIIHLVACSYDGMAGMETTQVHRNTLQRAHAIDKFQTRYLSKGTQIRGSVEFPGEIDDERLKKIEAYLAQNYVGDRQKKDVLLLTDGAKLNNTTISPKDSELIAQQKATTMQVAQITGVPPQFLYEFSDAKYNNAIEAMGQDVVRYTFRPWINQAEDELTVKLLSLADQDAGWSVHLNPDALIRGDTRTQTDTVTRTVAAGVWTPNEGRAVLGYPPSEDPEANKLKVSGDTTVNKPDAGGAAADDGKGKAADDQPPESDQK